VEEIEGQDRGPVGAAEQWISPGEGGRHVTRRRGRSIPDGEESG
jgi:hypothetical protein